MASADKDKLGADLSAYLDGELNEERARQIEKLLSESEDARRTLAQLRTVSQRLRDLPRERAPDGLPASLARSAERQVLFQQRPPIGRARLFKLVTQITASAALIAACVFTGWTVLQHTGAPAPPTVGHDVVATEPLGKRGKGEERLARRFSRAQPTPTEAARTGIAESDAEAPAVAMLEGLEALGYAGKSGPESSTATPAASPPTAAGQDLRAAGRIAAALGEAAKPEARHFALGAVPVQADHPTVNIVITPRDAEQFNAASHAVAQWQEPTPSTAGQKDSSAALTQQEFVVQVPPDQFHEVLRSLDQQAPEQVQVVMNFNAADVGQLRHIVAPLETPPSPGYGAFAKKRVSPADLSDAIAQADTPEREHGPALGKPDAAGKELTAGRGGGRVARTAAGPRGGVYAETQEAEQPTLVDRFPAPEPPESIEADMAQPLRSRGEVLRSGAAGERKGASPTEKEKYPLDQRHPRVEDVAAGVRIQPATPTAEEELAAGPPVVGDATPTTPAAPPTAVAVRNRVAEIRDHLTAVCEIILDTALHPPPPQDQPELSPKPPPMTVHVMLLPPPASTVQPEPAPTTSPVTPPTETP